MRNAMVNHNYNCSLSPQLIYSNNTISQSIYIMKINNNRYITTICALTCIMSASGPALIILIRLCTATTTINLTLLRIILIALLLRRLGFGGDLIHLVGIVVGRADLDDLQLDIGLLLRLPAGLIVVVLATGRRLHEA